jgi:AcrR family transcriptional regulator
MDSTEQRRPVGRPRSETARRAILLAALELAYERGADGLTMDAIAKRASVSKETIYRWWHSKGGVLLEALTDLGERTIPVVDGGSLILDLRLFMRATARALAAPTRRLLRTLAAGAAADSANAAEVRERFLEHRRAALASILERAVVRGELSAERTQAILDLVFGSLWYRLIFGIGPLNQKWADAVTDAIGAAAAGAGLNAPERL